MSAARWKIALVGVGEVAWKHLDALQALDGRVAVVSAVEPDAIRRARVAARMNILTFGSLRELLGDDHGAHVALITSPSHLHAAQIAEAAAHGLHCIVEKPFAMTSAGARRAIDAIRRADRRLFVSHQLRAAHVYDTIRQIIADGALGDVHSVTAQVFLRRDPAYFEASPWRVDAARGGDVLHNQAIHALDLLVWWFGRPDEAQMIREQRPDTTRAARSAAMIMRWGHTIGSLHATTRSTAHDAMFRVCVLGVRGAVEVCDGVIMRWEVDAVRPDVADRGSELRARWLARVFDALDGEDQGALFDVNPCMIVCELLDQEGARG